MIKLQKYVLFIFCDFICLIIISKVRDDMAIYISVTNQQLSAESDFIKYEIAGTFTLLACLISMWHVWGHARHFGIY